ncbi:MAG TPA: hypothetical protein VK578_14535 [Edaphobacter sp.]|jgi:hypothetical protein|nr:hypothetical protein [Edaphobacter sp.]
MQVLCKPSNSSTRSDVHCPVCNQGFLLYWERSCPNQQKDTRHSIQQALHDHHLDTTDTAAHPEAAFNIPSWSGSPQFSAAALLGGAPV